jgi:hypothetical protein
MSETPTRELDELRRLGEELRRVFADERRAIAALDHPALERVADDKRRLVAALSLSGVRTKKSPEARALFAAIRVEARATAELAAAATEAVRALLGYEAGVGYDRRARRVTADHTRTLTAL